MSSQSPARTAAKAKNVVAKSKARGPSAKAKLEEGRRPSEKTPVKTSARETNLQADPLFLTFNGRPEVLDVINTGGDLVAYVSGTSASTCALFGAEIKLSDAIGFGEFGTVFDIKFLRGERQKRYVAKEIHAPVVTTSCTVKKNTSYAKNHDDPYDSSKTVVLAKKDFLCPFAYTEYAIGVLMGEIYRRGESRNFLETFSFAVCRDTADADARHYLFMEKIEKDRSAKITDNLLIQALHAIGVAHSHGVQHNDFNWKNIFVEKMSSPEQVKYQAGDVTLYLPETTHVVKVGDWGLSSKYARDHPKIVNDMNLWPDFFPPNFPCPCFDVVMLLLSTPEDR
jgi:hypothetical protein